LLGDNIISIIGQRLLRKLCSHCRAVDEDYKEEFVVYQSTGCRECSWSGYKGRVAVVEVLRFTPAIAELVASGVSTAGVVECARHDQYQTLADEALRLVRTGITSMTEVFRVIDVTNLKM